MLQSVDLASATVRAFLMKASSSSLIACVTCACRVSRCIACERETEKIVVVALTGRKAKATPCLIDVSHEEFIKLLSAHEVILAAVVAKEEEKLVERGVGRIGWGSRRVFLHVYDGLELAKALLDGERPHEGRA